jgi:hypothetical protein
MLAFAWSAGGGRDDLGPPVEARSGNRIPGPQTDQTDKLSLDRAPSDIWLANRSRVRLGLHLAGPSFPPRERNLGTYERADGRSSLACGAGRGDFDRRDRVGFGLGLRLASGRFSQPDPDRRLGDRFRCARCSAAGVPDRIAPA